VLLIVSFSFSEKGEKSDAETIFFFTGAKT